MLSKTEREYLEGKFQLSSSYRRVLNHKIRKKLKEFFMLELPLIKNSTVTEFGNVIMEFNNTSSNQTEENERRERDSNPRVLANTGSQGPRPTRLGDLCGIC